LRRHRGEVHGRIVGALRRLYPDMEAAQPELFAHHCVQAGLIEPAVDYLLAAGERSLTQSAIPEARTHLERGLGLITQLADGTTRRRLEAAFQLALANVAIVKQGYGGPEAATRFRRAVELARSLDRDELLIRALFGDWTFQLHVGNVTGSLALAQEMADRGAQQDDRRLRLAGATALGMTHAFLGDFKEACVRLEGCLAECGANSNEGFVSSLPQDTEVLARSSLSLPLASLGLIRRSADEVARAIERGRQLRHHPSLAVALANGCRQAWLVRDERLIRARATELVWLCEAHGYPYWLARGQCYAGAMAMVEGREMEGLALIRKGMMTLSDSGTLLWNIYGLLADAHARCGLKDEALRLADRGLDLSSQTSETWTDAELYRVKGLALLMSPQADEALAERAFERALDIARTQSARLFELRTAVNLARLWVGQGRARAARALLAPMREWFTDDDESTDLLEAVALLRESSGAVR